MKKAITSILVFLALLTFISCRKYPKCEEPLDVNQSYILLSFKDINDTYIHSEDNPLFSKDSLKIKDENGIFYSVIIQRALIPNTSLGYWEFDLGPIYNSNTDASSFDTTLCKKFIIFYRPNETDTIQTCFKTSKTDCGWVFSILKVYNKGQLISEEKNRIATECTIIKN